MYIDMETIITVSKAVGAITALLGILFAGYRWYLKQNGLSKTMKENKEEQDKKIDELKAAHDKDIKKIEEEACLHTYGILACLKGLQEKGCNGPVTEAIDKFEKYINKRAHDQEE